MKKTRMKVVLTATKNEDGTMNVNASAVYSEDPNSENKAFSDATPCGNLYLTIAAGKAAQENFEVGNTKEYYVDIIPVEE